MKELLDDVLAAVSAVTGIEWADMDLGQLEADPPPVSWPCVLIGLVDGQFDLLGGDDQLGEIRLSVRVAFRLRERTHTKANVTYRAEAMAHLDQVSAVHRALQGLSGECFKAMSRLSIRNERRPDYRVYEMIYSLVYMEPAQAPGSVPEYRPWDDAGGDPPGPSIDIIPDLIL